MASFNTGGYSAAFGGIPQLPNPIATQGEALAGNNNNLGQLLGLLSGIDQSQQTNLLAQYGAAIPNYGALTKSASTNVGQELSGQLPTNVINQIAQQGAERGVSTGMPGSDNSTSAYLSALGLNSLNMMQQGQQNLATMTQTAPVAGLFNPAAFLVTPEQEQQEAAAQSIYNSAPIPAAAAAQAMKTASAVGGGGSAPWWAQGSGLPAAIAGAPGTYQTGPGTWHTPVMA